MLFDLLRSGRLATLPAVLREMYYVSAVLGLIGLGYIGVNIVRYPWHTLVFVGAAIALSYAAGGGSRLMAHLNASPHPAARRFVAGCAELSAIVKGVPPYNKARWWIARSLVQFVYWVVMAAMILAVLAALGGIFVWLDRVRGDG